MIKEILEDIAKIKEMKWAPALHLHKLVEQVEVKIKAYFDNFDLKEKEFDQEVKSETSDDSKNSKKKK